MPVHRKRIKKPKRTVAYKKRVTRKVRRKVQRTETRRIVKTYQRKVTRKVTKKVPRRIVNKTIPKKTIKKVPRRVTHKVQRRVKTKKVTRRRVKTTHSQIVIRLEQPSLGPFQEPLPAPLQWQPPVDLHNPLQKTCDRTADAVYKVLMSPDVLGLATSYAFVNATFQYLPNNKVIITFTGKNVYPTSRRVLWVDIQCNSVSDFIKASPCTAGKNAIIFFRYSRTLGEYIRHLHNGVVSRAQHTTLWNVVFNMFPVSAFPNGFVNHNEGVDLLHFKQPG